MALLFTLIPLTGHAQQTLEVLVIKSDDSLVYDQVVNRIQRQLEQVCEREAKGCRPVLVQSLVSDDTEPADGHYELVITLGVMARDYARRYLAKHQTLNAMIPYEFVDAGEGSDKSVKTARILLDQPITRLLGLINQCLPDTRSVGVLYSDKNTALIAELEKQAAKSGLNIISRKIDDENEVGKVLSQLLPDIDVLLAIPDIRIHNRRTVTNLLLSSYRNRVPVIAFSAAYVRAGALGAVYSTPEEIGKQLAEIVERFSRTKRLSIDNPHPKYFSVSLNYPVARSLDIQLPDVSFIERQLEASEGR